MSAVIGKSTNRKTKLKKKSKALVAYRTAVKTNNTMLVGRPNIFKRAAKGIKKVGKKIKKIVKKPLVKKVGKKPGMLRRAVSKVGGAIKRTARTVKKGIKKVGNKVKKVAKKVVKKVGRGIRKIGGKIKKKAKKGYLRNSPDVIDGLITAQEI